MGWPGQEASIPALALGGKNSVPRIRNVELLGHKGTLNIARTMQQLGPGGRSIRAGF